MEQEHMLAKFYEQSERVIEQWKCIDLSNSDSYKDPFLIEQKKIGKGLLTDKYIDLMPEPFWGDPKNCLAVMINLNPGCGDDDTNYIGRDAIKKSDVLKSGYVNFAKTSPYLTNAAFHPAATSWWAKRLAWLHKVLDCKGDSRYPFVSELCPWHSKKWDDAKISFTKDQLDYVYEVLKAAAFASKNALTPIVFIIGKADSVIKSLNSDKAKVEDVNSWGPECKTLDNISDYREDKNTELIWPQRKGKKKHTGIDENEMFDKNVYFNYYKVTFKEGETVKLLNIWMKGSNHTPSDEFLPIERSIIKYIKSN